ncbi:MAG: glycoside hydrolase family 15 protein, partial [Candidatus Woesearchaeota archaeon]
TFSPTGAIVAAPTTSIPEEVGSERTWDYRFCWVRDAVLCADSLKKIGRRYEAKKLLGFFLNRVLSEKHLQIMYGIHGEVKLEEKELGHLAGFKGSKPVRVGNAAHDQIQHDIYGEMIDLIYLYFVYYQYEKKMGQKYWKFLSYLVKKIKKEYAQPDSGIWEFRGILRHYTYSKFMCYIGVDRAIKIAQCYGRDKLVQQWLPLKEKLFVDICKKGFNQEKKAFTMYYGSKDLDASLLHMAYHEFLEKNDPRLISTVKAIYHNLRNDYLVQRYKVEDDFGKSKSAFTICSFWLVDALWYIGEVGKARKLFNKLVKRGNHLGLFSEDIDIKSKKLLGNFPQAYVHLALINSSILLSEWSAKRKKIDWSLIPKKEWF